MCRALAKMGVAVMVGNAISKLPPLLVSAVTAASFLGVAFTLWRKPAPGTESKQEHPASKAAMVSFAAIFFSEWGDVGQITAAALSAKYAMPLVVWLGAVSAMATKGALAASIGAGVRHWISERVTTKVLRYSGVGMLLLLGLR
jgi:putative Ca2+/H+ antiporter (TMEM165/GDT1 family)